MTTLNVELNNRDDWHELLEHLYRYWILAGLPVTIYPSGRCKGSLRLDGVIGGRSIGMLTH